MKNIEYKLIGIAFLIDMLITILGGFLLGFIIGFISIPMNLDLNNPMFLNISTFIGILIACLGTIIASYYLAKKSKYRKENIFAFAIFLVLLGVIISPISLIYGQMPIYLIIINVLISYPLVYLGDYIYGKK